MIFKPLVIIFVIQLCAQSNLFSLGYEGIFMNFYGKSSIISSYSDVKFNKPFMNVLSKIDGAGEKNFFKHYASNINFANYIN